MQALLSTRPPLSPKARRPTALGPALVLLALSLAAPAHAAELPGAVDAWPMWVASAVQLVVTTAGAIVVGLFRRSVAAQDDRWEELRRADERLAATLAPMGARMTALEHHATTLERSNAAAQAEIMRLREAVAQQATRVEIQEIRAELRSELKEVAQELRPIAANMAEVRALLRRVGGEA